MVRLALVSTKVSTGHHLDHVGGEVAGGEVVAVWAQLGLEVAAQRPVAQLRLRYRGGGGGVAGGGASLLARAAP